MLAIVDRPLPDSAGAELRRLQAGVDAANDYPARVKQASLLWASKTSASAGREAFRIVRATLSKMSIGVVRCAYCEDSLADEIEHVRPKTLFPTETFDWRNLLFSCGPCNGPKSNRYGYLEADRVVEFVRRRNEPVRRPPKRSDALINPRREEPLDFLDLDLGGVTGDGQRVEATFQILPAYGLTARDEARAAFTIDVLGLNREVIRMARGNAFGGFRARLREYVALKRDGAPRAELAALRKDILLTPHLTVFAEMRRQRARLPEIDALLREAQEAAEWRLVPPPSA